jgi:hypothetical protein
MSVLESMPVLTALLNLVPPSKSWSRRFVHSPEGLIAQHLVEGKAKTCFKT